MIYFEKWYTQIMQLALATIVFFWMVGESPLLIPPAVWFLMLVIAHSLGTQRWVSIYADAKQSKNIDWLINYWITVVAGAMFLSFPPNVGYIFVMTMIYSVLYMSTFLIKHHLVYFPTCVRSSHAK